MQKTKEMIKIKNLNHKCRNCKKPFISDDLRKKFCCEKCRIEHQESEKQKFNDCRIYIRFHKSDYETIKKWKRLTKAERKNIRKMVQNYIKELI